MSSDVPANPSGPRPYEPQPPAYPGSGGSSAAPPPYPGFASDPQSPPAYPQYGGYGDQPGSYGGQPPSPAKRPGAVTAAAAITIAMSAITGLSWIVLGLGILVAGDRVIDEAQKQANFMRALDDAGMTLTDLRDAVSILGPVALGAGILMLLAIIPAVGVLRGSRAARVTLVVLSVLTVLIGLFFTVTALVGLIWVVAGGSVIALLFLKDAQAWFAGRGLDAA